MLVLDEADVVRHDIRVLTGVSLRADNPGVAFALGPGGAGKSSLLAALCGRGEARLSGRATLDGRPLAELGDDRIAWTPQRLQLDGDGRAADALGTRFGATADDARRWLEEASIADAACLERPARALPLALRRYLAVRASLARPAALHLLDEPTAELDDALVPAVRAAIGETMRHACVVVATHNRADCLALGGRVALLAGGTVQECAPTAQFFERPATQAGATYVATGNCGLPVGVQRQAVADGIWWLVPGLLCGMSRPGMAADPDTQYRRLAQDGVRLLVCAEERPAYPPREPSHHGLRLVHVPIPDMGAPSFSQAVDLCRQAEPLIRGNEGVAVHCRGGLGRTGTLLAAILIWFGDAADDAIAKVKTARPLAIQSNAQAIFLRDFAERIAGWR